MQIKQIAELFEIVKRKHEFDEKGDWFQGSSTYFDGLIDEIEEVKSELKLDRRAYLEDELGDVLWDYLQVLYNLELEGKISIESLLKRVVNKYSERTDAIRNGLAWEDVKFEQQQQLSQEQSKLENS